MWRFETSHRHHPVFRKKWTRLNSCYHNNEIVIKDETGIKVKTNKKADNEFLHKKSLNTRRVPFLASFTRYLWSLAFHSKNFLHKTTTLDNATKELLIEAITKFLQRTLDKWYLMTNYFPIPSRGQFVSLDSSHRHFFFDALNEASFTSLSAASVCVSSSIQRAIFIMTRS